MSRIRRTAWAAMTIIASGLLPFSGAMPVAASGASSACGEASTLGAATSTSATSSAVTAPAYTADGPWDRYALPGGPEATERHLVVTGAQTATLIWRERHHLYVARSTDGGHTFAWVTELVDPEQGARHLSVASSGQTIHLLSDMRYRRSTDGGVTWTAPRSLATHAINAGLWADADGTVAVAWWNRAALQTQVSTNGGRTFRAPRVLAPYDEGSGCAAAEPGPVQVLGAGGSLLVSTGQAGTILVRSRDGGATWQDVHLWRFSGVIASDGSTLMATAGYQGQVRISTDGGRTWGDRIAAAPSWIDSLAYTGGRWWVLWGAGYQLKAQSSHRGNTWGDRTIVGPQTGWDTDLSTLAGHTVILTGSVLAIRPS